MAQKPYQSVMQSRGGDKSHATMHSLLNQRLFYIIYIVLYKKAEKKTRGRKTRSADMMQEGPMYTITVVVVKNLWVRPLRTECISKASSWCSPLPVCSSLCEQQHNRWRQQPPHRRGDGGNCARQHSRQERRGASHPQAPHGGRHHCHSVPSGMYQNAGAPLFFVTKYQSLKLMCRNLTIWMWVSKGVDLRLSIWFGPISNLVYRNILIALLI